MTPAVPLRIQARPGRPTLLCIHGLARSGDDFAEAFTTPALEGWGVIAPDLPGFGHSAAPPGFDYTMESYAGLVAGYLEDWGVTPAHPAIVLGHSLGGAVAVLLAEQAADRIRQLVLAEANLTERDAVYSRAVAAVDSPEAFAPQWAAAVERWEGMRDVYHITDAPALRDRILTAMRQTSAPAVYHAARSLYRLTADEDWWPRVVALHRARVPMAGIYGVRSMPDGTPVDLLEAADIPTAIVPDAGHMMMLDQPAAFYAAVRAVGEVSPAARSSE